MKFWKRNFLKKASSYSNLRKDLSNLSGKNSSNAHASSFLHAKSFCRFSHFVVTMCYFSPTLLFPISFTFLRLKDLFQISKWSPVFEFSELLELIWIFLIVKMYFKKILFQSGSKIARKFRIFHTKLGPHRLKKAWKISGKINFLPFNSRKTSRKQLITTSMKILNSRNL